MDKIFRRSIRKPYALTKEEEDIMERLERAFEKLRKITASYAFLLKVDYKVYNGNLLHFTVHDR